MQKLDDYLESLDDETRLTLTYPEIWNAALNSAISTCDNEIEVLARDKLDWHAVGVQGCRNRIEDLKSGLGGR
jgi:hypothetical protein